MSIIHRTIALRLLVGVAFSLIALSCKQYEYASPLPGVLEVRLKVMNSPAPVGHGELIPFGGENVFNITLKELNVVVDGIIKQPVFADLYAIRRNADGDQFNVLDVDARDSTIILGQAYVPPTTYAGLDMTVNFDAFLLITRTIVPIPIFILVNQPAPPAPQTPTFFQVPPLSQPLNFKINEGRVTRVTVTLNLDTVLVRRSEFFEIYPAFYVSSVQYF